MYATRCSLCLIPASEKTLSLTENLDFTPASGPIEVRQFFKIQTQARPEPNPKSSSLIDNYGMYTCTVHFAVQMSLPVPHVLIVILKSNTRNYLKII